MDVRELRYFLAIARFGSFSRAALHLNITQPALSRKLKKLEEELGGHLFIRTQKGVVLTETGTMLLPQAESHLFALNDTVRQIRDQRGEVTGQVVLGLAPTSGLLVAPLVLDQFKARWPHASLILREGISSSLEEWLADRRVDLAMLHNPLPIEGLTITPVLSEHMVLVQAPEAASESHWSGSVTMTELARVPLILPSLPHSNRRLIEQAASQHGVMLNVVTEVDSVPLVRTLVKQGFGASIMTFAGSARDVGNGELAATPIARPPLISHVAIGMPREARSNWIIAETARILRSSILALVDQGLWPGGRILADVI